MLPSCKNCISLHLWASGEITLGLQQSISKTGKLRTCSKIIRPHLCFAKDWSDLTCSLDFLCFVSCIKARNEKPYGLSRELGSYTGTIMNIQFNKLEMISFIILTLFFKSIRLGKKERNSRNTFNETV